MCSSPKSSRAVNKTAINFNDELTQEQRLRFAAKANLAQERREQREATNKRYEQKHASSRSSSGLFSVVSSMTSMCLNFTIVISLNIQFENSS